MESCRCFCYSKTFTALGNSRNVPFSLAAASQSSPTCNMLVAFALDSHVDEIFFWQHLHAFAKISIDVPKALRQSAGPRRHGLQRALRKRTTEICGQWLHTNCFQQISVNRYSNNFKHIYLMSLWYIYIIELSEAQDGPMSHKLGTKLLSQATTLAGGERARLAATRATRPLNLMATLGCTLIVFSFLERQWPSRRPNKRPSKCLARHLDSQSIDLKGSENPKHERLECETWF